MSKLAAMTYYQTTTWRLLIFQLILLKLYFLYFIGPLRTGKALTAYALSCLKGPKLSVQNFLTTPPRHPQAHLGAKAYRLQLWSVYAVAMVCLATCPASNLNVAVIHVFFHTHPGPTPLIYFSWWNQHFSTHSGLEPPRPFAISSFLVLLLLDPSVTLPDPSVWCVLS